MAMSPMSGFTFGCDPEMFIRDHNGRAVSAAGILPGTKTEPYRVDGGAVQVDGMAAEFNIDPSSSFEEFNSNISKVLKTMEKMLPTGYTYDYSPHITFDKEVFENAPDEAKELGCSPDYNAWTGEVNPPPAFPQSPFLRTASGHLHIGWTDDAEQSDIQHLANCNDLVKQLDYYLGGWSLKYDQDGVRRKMYGRAGACRYKPYGVEYRVLSNFWVPTRDRRLNVWNRMQQAIWDMSPLYVPERAKKFNDFVIASINGDTSEFGSDTPLTSLNVLKYPIQTVDSSYLRI
jgi:hypothetical protein